MIQIKIMFYLQMYGYADINSGDAFYPGSKTILNCAMT